MFRIDLDREMASNEMLTCMNFEIDELRKRYRIRNRRKETLKDLYGFITSSFYESK